jgi:hypothetical protein
VRHLPFHRVQKSFFWAIFLGFVFNMGVLGVFLRFFKSGSQSFVSKVHLIVFGSAKYEMKNQE